MSHQHAMKVCVSAQIRLGEEESEEKCGLLTFWLLWVRGKGKPVFSLCFETVHWFKWKETWFPVKQKETKHIKASSLPLSSSLLWQWKSFWFLRCGRSRHWSYCFIHIDAIEYLEVEMCKLSLKSGFLFPSGMWSYGKIQKINRLS